MSLHAPRTATETQALQARAASEEPERRTYEEPARRAYFVRAILFRTLCTGLAIAILRLLATLAYRISDRGDDLLKQHRGICVAISITTIAIVARSTTVLIAYFRLKFLRVHENLFRTIDILIGLMSFVQLILLIVGAKSSSYTDYDDISEDVTDEHVSLDQGHEVDKPDAIGRYAG